VDKLKKILRYLVFLKWPALIAGFISIFALAYYPFSLKITNFVAIKPPGRSFLMFWVWREWVSTFFINSFIHAKPFNLVNFMYFGILSNGRLPETGTVLDIILISYPLKQWLSLPFPLYYNIKFVIILLINSLAGYYAIRQLTKREDVGILCGIFMVVNPFLFIVLTKARLRVGILGFAILCLYYLYELSKRPNYKTAIWCGVFLAVSSLFYAFYGMFLLVIILMVFIGKAILEIIRKRPIEIWKFFKQLVLVFIVMTVIIAPWIIPYLSQIEKIEGETQVVGVKFFKDIPHPREVYAPEFRQDPTGHHLGVVRLIMAEEMPLYYYFPIVFSLFGVLAFFKPRPLVFLMLGIFLVFYVLCLGPYLKLIDNPEIEGFYTRPNGEFVPLPYIFFYKYVPFISRLHHPDHYLSFASVALMFLVGMGLANLFNFFDRKKIGFFRFGYLNPLVFAALGVSLVMGVKLYHPRMKYDMCRIEVPKFYLRLVREPFCGIYELPILKNDPKIQEVYDRYDFYQAFHHKKYIQSRYENLTFHIPRPGGQPRMFDEDYRKLDNAGNRFQKFLAGIHKGAEPFYSEKDLKQIKDFNYKYIILHEVEFVRYCETLSPPLEGAERFKHYKKAKEYFMSSDKFELVDMGDEYSENLVPTRSRNVFLNYEIAVFKIK